MREQVALAPLVHRMCDLADGDLFVFVSKNRRRAKVLYFDGTGLCLFAKRMESEHRFPAPWKMSKK